MTHVRDLAAMAAVLASGEREMAQTEGAGRTAIVLIHGTFATGAPWTRPDSWFARSLATALARRSVTATDLTFIDWSGGNSHAARREGSRRLVEHLRTIGLRPHDNCFLVGHSHGGNVALHAIVHDDQVRERVGGVVTLATPFLFFRDEAPLVARVAAGLDASALAAMVWAAIPLLGGALLLPLSLLLHGLFDWKIAWISGLRRGLIDGCSLVFQSDRCQSVITGATGAVDGGIATLITLAILFGGFVMAEEQHREERKAAVVRMAEFAYLQPTERLSGTPILAMSAPVDEALQVLNASWWSHRVTLWIMRAAVAAALTAGTAATLFALARLGFHEQSVVGTSSFTVQSSTFMFLAKIMLIPLAFAVGALVGAVLRLSASLPAFGFGSQSGRDNLHWTVTARRYPEGSAMAKRRSYGLIALLKRGGPMIHSRLYASERAVEDVADFIAEEAGRRRVAN